MNFCDKCNKIVPDKEVKDIFNNGTLLRHSFESFVNHGSDLNSDIIGCCLIIETVWCGEIREPTPEEYFIYHTLSLKK